MPKRSNKKTIKWLLTPIFGTTIFVVLYVMATLLYPGGSQADKNSEGFSWINNYWCNLLNTNAINGEHNPAKPIAITGMLVLCVTLAFFWYIFPRHSKISNFVKLTIQVSGAIAMMIAFLLFTNINHDLVTNLASVFGLVATIGTLIILYKDKWYALLAAGFLNLLLVALNSYLYYNKGLLIYLPLVQKLSFASFLLWICAIDARLYRYSKNICLSKRQPSHYLPVIINALIL